ncbi:ATP-binding protein, partial [Calothrix sp. UHCC 0171]|uniref:ATP-binding protein n=1 Tax=Calothrix sp. UHCC 0171 TaxID=3110245 RepID=UPI002B200F63
HLGKNLTTLVAEAEPYLAVLSQHNLTVALNYSYAALQTIQRLQGNQSQAELAIQVEQLHRALTIANDLSGLHFYWVCRLTVSYLFGETLQASQDAAQARQTLAGGAGFFSEFVFYFYDSLTALAEYPEAADKMALLARISANQKKLQHRAKYAPMNFQHKYDLVEAERYRVLGKKYEAGDYYDRAIAGAKANEYIQEEGLANELAAKFYLNWGKEKIAYCYMQSAYYCYAKWGANAKITHLEQNYPQLLGAILQPGILGITNEGTITATQMGSLTNVNTSQNLWLDVPAVIKAAQAISQEIELDKLLTTLIQIAIANAGAQKGYLILRQDEQWLLVVRSDSERTQRLQILLAQCQELPQSLIYSVLRSQKVAVFDNLSTVVQFAGDNYISTHQPKSVLCTPITQQGKLIGILYLENNLTVGAFTSDRLQVIQLLTAQASISLENAQLYCQLEEYSHSLEEKVSERTQELTQKATQLESTLQELQRTQSQLIQAEKMSGLGQLVAGIAHEINNPINFIYGNMQPASEYVTSLIELNHLYQKNYPQPIPEIEDKIADMELDFLVNDLQKLFKSMKLGADRIRQIVLSLRNFSRLDEAEIKPVDIHEGIDSTLLILQHRLKSSSKSTEISLIKEYSQIPLVDCYPSALNQVFINILSNAIDALKELDINHKPTITIRTEIQEQKYVAIRIIDNGMGIEESVQNKIFEPFFTTKPVGSGTGLGLSISYSIVVEQHGGKLSCISAPGKGTEFVIQIPL